MQRTLLRSILTPTTLLQLIIGWAGVFFFRIGSIFFQLPQAIGPSVILLIGIIAVIMWAAFGVVTQADHLARRLGDPYGTLVLTLSIVLIEVVLIAAVMLGPGDHPTIARDSVMAVSMIILNLVVGLALLVSGLRHPTLPINRTGVASYIGVLLPLLTIALVLPTVIGDDGAYSLGQTIPVTVMTILVYGFFLYLQVGRQRADFQELEQSSITTSVEHRPVAPGQRSGIGKVFHMHRREIIARTLLLIATVLPIVLLSHDMASYLDRLLDRLSAPMALSGIVIAAIVFLPETVTALRTAYAGQLQRVSNLCHGALVSTVGLTIPVVLIIGMVSRQSVILGVSFAHLVLLAISLALTLTSTVGGRPTPMHGAAHLMIFGLYLMMVFT